MKSLKRILAISALSMGVVLPISSMAQMAMDHNKMGAPMAASMTQGEVRKVDLDAGKVTIKHGEIKHLDMPGMTMVFTAKDKSILSNLKPGEKVEFMVVQESGKFVVTEIKPAR